MSRVVKLLSGMWTALDSFDVDGAAAQKAKANTWLTDTERF
jgi:hypothetical protein